MAAAQTFCSGTVANLVATGTSLQWYAVAINGTALATSTALATGTYYVSQTLNSCESTRTSVAVTVNTTAAPTGVSPQTLALANATIANLVVSPTNVVWYGSLLDATSGTNALLSSTALKTGATYYAVSIAGGCSSSPLAISTTATLGTEGFDTANFNFYPNPTSGILNINYSKKIAEVSVVNLLGQVVLNKKTNTTEVEIDLSSFPIATYLIKVVSEGKTQTIKVLKNK
jgi:hypothetical protein